MKLVAVTGCLGFIGKCLTRLLLERGDYVVGIDAETYAADLLARDALLDEWGADPGARFKYVKADIRTLEHLPDVDAVLHLAAESHVDNSIADPCRFIETNVGGTAHLLELLRGKRDHDRPILIHISTDEVYGSMGSDQWATPDRDLRPASPYAASKAAADLLVQSWGETYDIRARTIRPSNCYGPGQYPEKLIPKCIRSLSLERPIPIHGDGSATRQWLHVEDCASAILQVLDHGEDWAIYNIAGNTETQVKEIVREVISSYFDGFPPRHWTEYVTFSHTRPGMDTRYGVDDQPLRDIGWRPNHNLWKDLPSLVALERQLFRF